jgi:hypothetical protein
MLDNSAHSWRQSVFGFWLSPAWSKSLDLLPFNLFFLWRPPFLLGDERLERLGFCGEKL